MYVVRRGRGQEDDRTREVPGSPQRPAGNRARICAFRSGSSRQMPAVSSVLKYPGAIALTFTPCGAHSLARAFVSCPTPPLVAAYDETLSPPEKLSIEATVTIFPRPCGTMIRPASWQSSKTELRFVRRTSSQSESSCSSAGTRRPMPCATTRTSSPPSAATACSNPRLSSPRSLRSARTAKPPSSCAASSACSERATTATRAPASANAPAIARPSPRPPPVTSARAAARSKWSVTGREPSVARAEQLHLEAAPVATMDACEVLDRAPAVEVGDTG